MRQKSMVCSCRFWGASTKGKADSRLKAHTHVAQAADYADVDARWHDASTSRKEIPSRRTALHEMASLKSPYLGLQEATYHYLDVSHFFLSLSIDIGTFWERIGVRFLTHTAPSLYTCCHLSIL